MRYYHLLLCNLVFLRSQKLIYFLGWANWKLVAYELFKMYHFWRHHHNIFLHTFVVFILKAVVEQVNLQVGCFLVHSSDDDPVEILHRSFQCFFPTNNTVLHFRTTWVCSIPWILHSIHALSWQNGLEDLLIYLNVSDATEVLKDFILHLEEVLTHFWKRQLTYIWRQKISSSFS